MTMIDSGWDIVEDRALADPLQALVRWGKVRLVRRDQEFALVADAVQNADGNIRQIRVALRRGGGAFAGPGGTYPAVGTIFDSVTMMLTTPAVSLQAASSTDRGRVRQAARQLLDRAARHLDSPV